VFFHYVARHNPTITVEARVKCDTCKGAGSFRGIVRKDTLDLGVIVSETCGSCNGRGGSTQSFTIQVTYSGKLPPLPPVGADRRKVSAYIQVRRRYLAAEET
jgi:hypothetical protein